MDVAVHGNGSARSGTKYAAAPTNAANAPKTWSSGRDPRPPACADAQRRSATIAVVVHGDAGGVRRMSAISVATSATRPPATPQIGTAHRPARRVAYGAAARSADDAT